MSSREWLPLVAELGCARQVWTVDLPGFGASRGLRCTLGLPALTDALVDWLGAARLARVCLIGGSFGCQVAVNAAVRYPDRVSHLVRIGPTVDPGRAHLQPPGRALVVQHEVGVAAHGTDGAFVNPRAQISLAGRLALPAAL